MSRTNKDKPNRILHKSHFQDREHIALFSLIDNPTTKTKKRKEVDSEWHWMSTPSWWTRLMMNRPQRRKAKLWEREISKIPCETEVLCNLSTNKTSVKLFLKENMEDAICAFNVPDASKKPHRYYW